MTLLNLDVLQIFNPLLQLELWDFLLGIIGLLFLASVGFFVATLLKRLRKIRQEESKKSYQAEIDQVLFGIMFGQEGAAGEIPFSLAGKSKLFKKVMIKSLIGLHNNFSGSYNTKLEAFFVQSGLVKYSLKKLNSRKWVQVVEGMRDLSALNYKEAYPRILQVKFENNDMVQQEKLIARIRLQGLGELWEFRDSRHYFNDWTQSNILFAIKNHKVEPVENLPELLYSRNESVALLGIRLIHYYHNMTQLGKLEEFRQNTKSPKLSAEINFLLKKQSFSKA